VETCLFIGKMNKKIALLQINVGGVFLSGNFVSMCA
jgi:hypothetical protein